MRYRHVPLLLAGLVFAASVAAPVAVAQSEAELQQQMQQQAEALLGGGGDGSDTMDPTESGGDVVGGDTTTAPLDDATPDGFDVDPDFGLSPDQPETSPDAAATAGPPLPPPYYMPGPGVAQNPVSSVARLTNPEVPLDPLRLGALGLSALMLAGIAGAGLSRALGWREPLSSPVAGRPSRIRRIGDAFVLLADDLRDFVRRRR